MHSSCSSRGHAAAEFALAFPFALAFLFILIDLSLFAVRQASFESSTRLAARGVAVDETCDASPAACVEAWLAPRAAGASAQVNVRAVAQSPASAQGRAARRVEVLDIQASAPYAPPFSLVARAMPGEPPALRAITREVRLR